MSGHLLSLESILQFNDLWSNLTSGAANREEVSMCANTMSSNLLSIPEIGNLKHEFIREKDVFTLQVSVAKSILLELMQSIEQLIEQEGSDWLWES